jgi:hypothetical protein
MEQDPKKQKEEEILIGEEPAGPDIKTMRKDLARVRLYQAEQEREKISKMEIEKTKPERVIEEIRKKEQERLKEMEKASEIGEEMKMLKKEPPVPFSKEKAEPTTPPPPPLKTADLGFGQRQEKEAEAQPQPEIQAQPPVQPKEPTQPQKKLTPQERLEQAKKRLEALKRGKRVETLEAKLEKIEQKPFAESKPEFEKPVRVLKPFPQKPGEKQRVLPKVLTVGLVVLLVAGIGGGAYWFLFLKERPVESQSEQQPSPPAAEQPAKQVQPHSSFIPVQGDMISELSNQDKVLDVVSELLKQDFGESKLTRVNIKSKQENGFLRAKELFPMLGIRTPEGLTDKIEENIDLVISSVEPQNRLGFVAKIKENQQSNLFSLLSSWEPTMEKDTEQLFQVLGGKERQGGSFRGAKYNGVVFRYVSFSTSHFGICWAVIDDYFVFTTSGKQMMQIIDLIQGP